MNADISNRTGLNRYLLEYLLILFCLFIVFPIDVFANGAISHFGYYGTELTIAENKPFENFVVDENVIIDLRNNTISVVYEVKNASEKEEKFTMLFPYESYGCAEDKEYDEEY